MESRASVVAIVLIALLCGLAWSVAGIQRASTVEPDALDKYGFAIVWDLVHYQIRIRRYHSDAPIRKVKADIIRQMTAAGWNADEKHGRDKVVVFFGRGYYNKAELSGMEDGKHGTWFDLREPVTFRGKLKSVLGLQP